MFHLHNMNWRKRIRSSALHTLSYFCQLNIWFGLTSAAPQQMETNWWISRQVIRSPRSILELAHCPFPMPNFCGFFRSDWKQKVIHVKICFENDRELAFSALIYAACWAGDCNLSMTHRHNKDINWYKPDSPLRWASCFTSWFLKGSRQHSRGSGCSSKE